MVLDGITEKTISHINGTTVHGDRHNRSEPSRQKLLLCAKLQAVTSLGADPSPSFIHFCKSLRAPGVSDPKEPVPASCHSVLLFSSVLLDALGSLFVSFLLSSPGAGTVCFGADTQHKPAHQGAGNLKPLTTRFQSFNIYYTVLARRPRRHTKRI